MTSDISKNPTPQTTVAPGMKPAQTDQERKDAAAKDEAAKKSQTSEGGAQKQQLHK